LELAWAALVTREDPDPVDLTSRLLAAGDDELLATLAAEAPPGSVAARLLHGLTGDRRGLYKRLITWSRVYEDPDKRAAYDRLYRLSPAARDDLLERLRARLSSLGRPLSPGALILDVPPRDKD